MLSSARKGLLCACCPHCLPVRKYTFTAMISGSSSLWAFELQSIQLS
jgi:hypothetical protein